MNILGRILLMIISGVALAILLPAVGVSSWWAWPGALMVLVGTGWRRRA